MKSIGQHLISHQLDSYNDFVTNKIHQIIAGFNDIRVFHKYHAALADFKYQIDLKVMNPKLNKPVINEKDGLVKIMTPLEARQRNYSYSSNLTCDIVLKYKNYDETDMVSRNASKADERRQENPNHGRV